ncbi:MAG: sensor histidine kinase [Campylobacterota bacterium]|nr:sensor histidine kinase [Campylobacterota bacterium]
MLKSVIVIILLSINAFALSIENISFATENNSSFIDTTLPIKIHDSQDYLIKIDINRRVKNTNEEYLLKIYTEHGRDYLEYSKEYPRDTLEKNLLDLSDSNLSSYLFKFNNATNSIYFDAEIVKKREYFKKRELKKLLYGVSYGVMLSAILYYLAFFIYNRDKSYIYYSLTQFFMLIILILVTIKSSGSGDEKLFAVLFSFYIISISLFTASFLQLKKYAPFYNKLIIVSGFILVFEAFTNFFTKLHIPTAELMLVYIVVAVVIYVKTQQKYILFYLLGWGIMIASLIFIEIQTLLLEKNYFSADDILHITIPLESLILAFALSYKMKSLEEEKQEKEQMLVHYDKKASIGDMVDNIAHQWRQPLTHIGYLVMNISAAIANNRLDEKLWNKKQHEINLQLEYMSKTIDDFRDFYNPNVVNEEFSVYECVHKVYQIIKPTLKLHEIELNIKNSDEPILFANESELSQVVLNLISNAKDAFEKNKIINKKINIFIDKKSIIVEDNAGGVDKSIEKNLFSLYTSTKKNGGVGLYMSHLIIEKHFNATINYTPIKNGSRFSINFLQS